MIPKGEYWDEYYRAGGTSGEGSVGRYGKWKWGIIESYIGKIDNVVDIGCGDLSFWYGRQCNRYFGLDISSTIVKRNMRKRPSWKFQVGRAEFFVQGVSGEIVLCLDMLFHIMDDMSFVEILKNLCQYSRRWIFIFTWNRNPFNIVWISRHIVWISGRCYTRLARELAFKKRNPINALALLTIDQLKVLIGYLRGSDRVYQRYRNLELYLDVFEARGFMLIAIHSYDFGAMYVFYKDR
jgi:hypothetical protein